MATLGAALSDHTLDATTLDDAAWWSIPQRWRDRITILAKPAATLALQRAGRSPSACWHMGGWNSGNGYAKVSHQGRDSMAHIVIFSLAGGVCPPGWLHDHLCRERDCVRPSHLEPVTVRVNTLRGEAKLFGRA